MRKGDISNEMTGRFLLVFEGLVGVLPDKKAEARFARAVKFRRWESAVNQFVINESCAKVIWDTVWRRNYSVDVVTFLAEEMTSHIRDIVIDKWDLPVGRVSREDKYMLARELNYRPNVIGVFHPNPADFAVYGGKGVVVDPSYPVLL